uniref:Secreted protein n=1 Tax=Cyprinus carpio TaxID=7962 RepID=A0A8C1VVA0_CYPCA
MYSQFVLLNMHICFKSNLLLFAFLSVSESLSTFITLNICTDITEISSDLSYTNAFKSRLAWTSLRSTERHSSS